MQQPYVINLASNEYFKSIQTDKLNAEIITPVFKDYKNGKYKIISFYAKKARGLMTAYIIKNALTEPEQLCEFNSDGYYFCDNESDAQQLVFQRD